MAKEIIFIVEDAAEGGHTARALGHSIFTQAESIDELKPMIRDAVNCFFVDSEKPQIIRLHKVRDEAISV